MLSGSVGRVTLLVEVQYSAGKQIVGIVRFSIPRQGLPTMESEVVRFVYRRGLSLNLVLPGSWAKQDESSVKAIAMEIGLQVLECLQVDEAVAVSDIRLEIGFG